MPEEEWLVHYMQGKIYEKNENLDEAIDTYFKSLNWMDKHGASYPKKVQYKQSSTDYVHESLEMFYRINASILKSYLNGKILDLTKYKPTVFLLMKTNFYTRKGWNEQKEEVILDTPEQILTQLGQNLLMIIERYPQHSKSYHLLSRLFIRRRHYEQARHVLFGTRSEALLGSPTSIRNEILKAQATQSEPLNYSLPPLLLDLSKVSGLFVERTKTNFFAGIWRTPSGDIDRPGNFSRHMMKCCKLGLQLISLIGEPVTLANMYAALSRTPEYAKRFLKEADRLSLLKSITESMEPIVTKVTQRQLISPSTLQERVLQIHRVLEVVQRKNIGAESFSALQKELKTSYVAIYPDQYSVSIDMINKYVKAVYSMRKARQADSSASLDVRDYLKVKKKIDTSSAIGTMSSTMATTSDTIVISDSPPPPPTLPLTSLVGLTPEQLKIQQLHKTQAELIQKLLSGQK